MKDEISDIREVASVLRNRMQPAVAGILFDIADRLEAFATPKAPQDVNLRELFDHVAIVNDAIRAALLTHPGMTPR